MQPNIKIAILGANGQLGKEFEYLHKLYVGFDFNFFDRSQLDIADLSACKMFFSKNSFDYVINCAAYTAVDKAESDQTSAYAINTLGCQNLVDTMEGTKVKIVHFSSDYVYHTYDGFPLRESSPTHPKSVYAKSKLAGEQILKNSNLPCLIIRTSWVTSSFGHNFVKTILRISAANKEIKIVNDQYGAPTYARHLASAVLDIITKVENKSIDIKLFNDTYNYANHGIVTWCQIAKTIVSLTDHDCVVTPIQTSEYPTPAERPKWSVLSLNKIKQSFGITIPHWKTGVEECMKEI